MPRVAAEAKSVVAATWPVACALYGAPGTIPSPPALVHLYRDPDAYRAAEEQLTGGRFRRNLAFTRWEDRSAHVAIQPALDDELLRRFGLNAQTVRLLAHETAHLARTHAMANFRVHPQWFADGNASWLESRVLRALGRLDDLDADATYATDTLRAQRLLRSDSLPDLRAILLDRIDDLSFYDRYAVRWLAFRWLVEHHRQALTSSIRALATFGGADDAPRRMLSVLEQGLAQPLPDADADFRRWLAELQPEWDERVRALDANGASWLQTAFASSDALAWRTAALSAPWRWSGAAEPLTDGAAMQLWLGAEGGAAQRVVLERDVIRIVVGDDTVATWPRTPSTLPIPLQVQQPANGPAILTIDGTAHPLPLPCDGRWGLGIHAGTAGRWIGITTTSKP